MINAGSERVGGSGWGNSAGNTYTHNAVTVGSIGLTLMVPTVTENSKSPYCSPSGAGIPNRVLSAYCKPAGYQYIHIGDAYSGGFGLLVFDSQTGTFTQNSLGLPVSAVSVGNGVYKFSIVFTSAAPISPALSASPTSTAVSVYGATFAGDGVSGVYIGGVEVRNPADSAYPYQRVNTATDYADVGAPRYLQADGVDDWMVTNSIDFTGTDKMTVWAGVRKLGGATAVQLLAELSTAATNPGVFSIFAPRSTSGTYNFLLNGNAAGSLSTDAAYPEPITNVLSCSFDISEPLLANEIRPRINGVIPTLGTLDVGPAGTGTFGNYPLYLFRRGGATLPFSGRLYGLIICGAASSMSHIVAGERWINGKTRAY